MLFKFEWPTKATLYFWGANKDAAIKECKEFLSIWRLPKGVKISA